MMTSIGRFIEVVGKLGKPDPGLVIARKEAKAADQIVVPLELLARAKSSALEQHLIACDMLGLVHALKPNQVSDALRAAATAPNLPIAIDRSGLHTIEVNGGAFEALVIGGRLHWLGKAPPNQRVKVVGRAANRIRSAAKLTDFTTQLAPILSTNPRLLVLLWMSVAGYFARAFGRDPMGVAIIGPTSSGKSLAQDLVVSLLGVPDPVRGLNATPAGILAYLSERPDAPVFLEDAQGESQAVPILRAIMDAGNATVALRGNAGGGQAHRHPITSTLILSAEVSLADTARAGRQAIHPGVFARVFEMGLGQHGIFDDPCGEPDGHSLAQRVKALTDPLRGVIGHHVLPKLAQDWKALTRRHAKLSVQMREALVKDLDHPLTALQGRTVDGLVFAASLGYLAHKELTLGVSHKTVFKAFRKVFKEHIERANLLAPPDQRECIEHVRQYLRDREGHFALWPQEGRQPPKFIDGFRKKSKGELLFLLEPEKFRAAFQALGPDVVLRHLRAARHLVCTGHRGLQLAVRTPWRGAGARGDFYAVRASILDA